MVPRHREIHRHVGARQASDFDSRWATPAANPACFGGNFASALFTTGTITTAWAAPASTNVTAEQADARLGRAERDIREHDAVSECQHQPTDRAHRMGYQPSWNP